MSMCKRSQHQLPHSTGLGKSVVFFFLVEIALVPGSVVLSVQRDRGTAN